MKARNISHLVVLDEAHHEATQSCVLLYEKMKSEYVLGLSATPMRTDRMKLSFQETVTTCSIDRLIREGYLSPFHSYLLPHYGPQIVGECYMNAPEKWGKTLAFFSTVMECCQFQKVLADFGVACEVVTAESDKDRQLEEFVAGARTANAAEAVQERLPRRRGAARRCHLAGDTTCRHSIVNSRTSIVSSTKSTGFATTTAGVGRFRPWRLS